MAAGASNRAIRCNSAWKVSLPAELLVVGPLPFVAADREGAQGSFGLPATAGRLQPHTGMLRLGGLTK